MQLGTHKNNHSPYVGKKSQSLKIPENIMIGVIRSLEFDVHQIYCGVTGSYEEDFHNRIVKADKVGDQIQISCRVREGKQ